MTNLRLVLAQLNTTVGDIAGNSRQIEAGLKEARALEADIALFPELAITGYPPEDLLLKPDFLQVARDALERLRPATKELIAIIGLPYVDGDLYNSAAVLQDGQLAGIYHKQHLPNYSVFDEKRYFRPGSVCPVFALGQVKAGVSVCEDIWIPGGPHKAQAQQGGAQVLLNISASPYRMGFGLEREEMIARRAADNEAFVVYCNLVGGQDELVFDGHSLVCSPDGEVIARGPQFEPALMAVDLDVKLAGRRRGRSRPGAAITDLDLAALPERPGRKPLQPPLARPLEPLAEVYGALVLGTRDYVRKNGFTRVVLGLSGGVDSSLTAAIAAAAIGPENVAGVAMPSRYSSPHSLHDAAGLAENLGLDYRVIPIDETYQAFLDMLSRPFEGLEPDVAEENIQARIRGSLLMALSNKFG